MYVKRDTLETELVSAVRQKKNIIIHGDSGCGKTWLYQSTFKNKSINFINLNAASVRTAGSMMTAITQLKSRFQPKKKVSHEESVSGGADIAILNTEASTTYAYTYTERDPYYELLEVISKAFSNKSTFLVIENVEHIVFETELVNQLSSLILYLDDDDYSKFNVKLLIVGTSSNLRELFSRTTASQTIINRVIEISEVSCLTPAQTRSYIEKGFLNYLGMEVDTNGFSEKQLSQYISWYSLDIPQYVQEICLQIAISSEDSKLITHKNTRRGISDWARTSLISDYTRITLHLNRKGSSHGRKNQVIFTLGYLLKNDFDQAEVERSVRNNFKVSTSEKKLNILAILSELSSGENPLIRKNPTRNTYRFISPKTKIVIRWLMQKNEHDETLNIKDFDDSIKIY